MNRLLAAFMVVGLMTPAGFAFAGGYYHGSGMGSGYSQYPQYQQYYPQQQQQYYYTYPYGYSGASASASAYSYSSAYSGGTMYDPYSYGGQYYW